MSNEMVPYADVEKMAIAIAKSGLFGVKTPDQAIAIMLIAQAEGRHPALAARDYDIIQNRPSKKSEAMLRDFLEMQGRVEWHALTDTAADATFSHPSGGSVRITWDMKRAQAAGLGAKDMWKKYPRQMLRARCVSEGIRTVCPMATSGMYVPEEVSDFAKAKDITPTAGADERIEAPEVAAMDALAVKVHELLNAGDVQGAVKAIDDANPDADQKVYLWTKFDSKQRSAMKKEKQRQKDEAEQDVPFAFQPLPEQSTQDKISDAQKKRLEARIAELKLNRNQVKEYVLNNFNVQTFGDLGKADYAILDAELLNADDPQGLLNAIYPAPTPENPI